MVQQALIELPLKPRKAAEWGLQDERSTLAPDFAYFQKQPGLHIFIKQII